jgi:sulfur-oxidizing protein SoxZ
MARALINVPATAKKGEAVEIKVLIQHPMETGFRTGPDGKLVPRDIIQRFSCTYAGQEVFAVDLFPAVAANPFFAFFTLATESGPLVFRWTDNAGREESETASIAVT